MQSKKPTEMMNGIKSLFENIKRIDELFTNLRTKRTQINQNN